MGGGQEDVELSKATTLILALRLQAPHQSTLLQVLVLRNTDCPNSAEMDRSLKSSFFFPSSYSKCVFPSSPNFAHNYLKHTYFLKLFNILFT